MWTRSLIALFLALSPIWGFAESDSPNPSEEADKSRNEEERGLPPTEAVKLIPGQYVSENKILREPLKIEGSRVSHGLRVISPRKRYDGDSRWDWSGGPDSIELRFRHPEPSQDRPELWWGRTIFRPRYGNYEVRYSIELRRVDDTVLVRELYRGSDETVESWKEHDKPYRLAGYDYYRYYEHLLSTPNLPPDQQKLYSLFLKLAKGKLPTADRKVAEAAALLGVGDVNVKDSLGQTLLMVSLMTGHRHVTQAILDSKPDVTLTNNKEETIYDYLTSKLNFHEEASRHNARDLIAYAPPQGDDLYRTVRWAIRHHFYEVVNTLVSGAPALVRDEALIELVNHAEPLSPELEKLITSLVVSQIDEAAATRALGILMEKHRFNSFTMSLFDLGLNPNGRDGEKRSVLMLAVIHNNDSMANYLIDTLKVDQTPRDEKGYSAAAYAAIGLNARLYQKLTNLGNLDAGFGREKDSLENLLADHFKRQTEEATRLIEWSESGGKSFINRYNSRSHTVLDKLVIQMKSETNDFTNMNIWNQEWRRHYSHLVRSYFRLKGIGAVTFGTSPPPEEYLKDPEVVVIETRPGYSSGGYSRDPYGYTRSEAGAWFGSSGPSYQGHSSGRGGYSSSRHGRW